MSAIVTEPRAVLETASYQGIANSDLTAWLQAQPWYRDSPLYIEPAGLIQGSTNQPVVASRTMCASPAVDGGYDVIWHNHLAGWHIGNLWSTCNSCRVSLGGKYC